MIFELIRLKNYLKLVFIMYLFDQLTYSCKFVKTILIIYLNQFLSIYGCECATQIRHSLGIPI